MSFQSIDAFLIRSPDLSVKSSLFSTRNLALIIVRASHLFTVYPPALFGDAQIGRKAKLLLTLINSKWPLGVDPGGHHFVVLNVSINKKLILFSEVVIFRKYN